jgi:NAD(P)H-flavin reductase/hemoglobin-like flavoprotein
MSLDPRRLQESFALVEQSAEQVAGHFYALLFLEQPGLRDLFPPMMNAQRDRLLGALVTVVRHAGDPQSTAGLPEFLAQLGRDHRAFGVRPEHYEPVGRCLVAAMRRFARPGWTPQMDEAWADAAGFAVGVMTAAAEQAARTTPAFWTGRVVGHHRPDSSLALLTVEPDQPYPFRPGQYAALETLRWPRVWRPYSIGNAPRPDGLLTFHVRAIDAGWVSTALVQHTRLGDTVRLGPAVGGLACDQASMRDVLLVGGGTGIAPLLAVAQDMARWNTGRRVSIYFGARRAGDLYALGALEALREHSPWLEIVPCVSQDSRYPGERGALADVLARHGADRFNWTQHDVLVAGPAAMMRTVLTRLAELEVPGRQIRFDAFGDQLGRSPALAIQEQTAPARRLLTSAPTATSAERLPQRQAAQHHETQHHETQHHGTQHHPAQRPALPHGRAHHQASKSSAISSEVGSDWQVSTNPPLFSSGSRA